MTEKNRPQTGREALQWAVSCLAAQGFDARQARTEARLLLAAATGRTPLAATAGLDENLAAADWETFALMTKRRAEHQPLQYLVGEQEFMSLAFRVTPAVLVPRWDTEILVEEALRVLSGLAGPRVLDVGTGSGAIAVSIAYYAPQAEVWAVDLSAEALAVASENAARLLAGEARRVRFLQGDLFNPLPQSLRFDLIVSNPPYISAPEMEGLPPDVQKEPRLALYGGEDGLDFYRRIVPAATGYLRPGGRLALEIGWRQGPAVQELLTRNGYRAVRVIKDLAGRERVILADKAAE